MLFTINCLKKPLHLVAFICLWIGGWALLFPTAAQAQAPCAGGTLDINATSDTPVTLPVFNVGQLVELSAQATGFTPTSYTWVIDGPHIKDYEDRLGTTATGPISWSTTPLAASDLATPVVSFYWKPSPSQIHPNNSGPVTRNVQLTVEVGGATCVVSQGFQVERNETDPVKQPVDFYTSNHRAPTETNPAKGRVIDDHQQWHLDASSRLAGFLPWHGRFLARFNQWRAEFGYPPEVAWHPGTPLPTGPDMAHSPRLPTFNPVTNRIPTWYTIAGNSAIAPLVDPDGPAGPFPGFPGGQRRLADFTSLTAMSNHMEFSYHGQVHCNIGPFDNTAPPPDFGPFGSMCVFSSPKDPIFWRWHGFIDLMYRNYCSQAGISCSFTPDPPTDLWVGDNAQDIANNGVPPSPGPHWLSPDIWNRTSLAPCTPTDPTPNVARDCGSSADHENPVAGVENYLYVTLRNDRPSANLVVYAEVAVYIANASTGLAWPTDFGSPPLPFASPLAQTRQLITLNLRPGEVTDIGPLPWIPPSPTPSDHWCLYVRILSPQDSLGIVEGTNISINTRDSNSIAWRNIKIVQPSPFAEFNTAQFIVRNVHEETELIDLVFEGPPPMFELGAVELELDDLLLERWRQSEQRVDGIEPGERIFHILKPGATLFGIPLEAREAGAITLRLQAEIDQPIRGLLHVIQMSRGEVDGGVTLQLGPTVDISKKPNLVVRIVGPLTARPGENIGEQIRLSVVNSGRADAVGTLTGGRAGYMVDLVLSQDEQVPVAFAPFSFSFQEDGLLLGGRVSRTQTLRPGEGVRYRVGALIPDDTPPGRYCLGAVVDPGRRIDEADETDNTQCHIIEITN